MDDKDILYKCLICNRKEIVKASDYRRDGRVCKHCGGHIVPKGFIGIDMARQSDMTAYITPPGQKNKKILGIWKNG